MAVPPLPRMLRNKKPPAARPRVVTVSAHCAPKAQISRIVHPWRRRSARAAGVYVHCPRSSAHHPLPCQKGLPALARSPPGDRRIRAPLPLWLSFGSTQRGVSDPAASGEALIRPLLSRPLASLDVSGQRRLFACTPRLTRCGCRSRRQHMPSTGQSQRAIWSTSRGLASPPASSRSVGGNCLARPASGWRVSVLILPADTRRSLSPLCGAPPAGWGPDRMRRTVAGRPSAWQYMRMCTYQHAGGVSGQ